MDLTTSTPSAALLTVVLLALAPFVAVMVTSFTKNVVVPAMPRNALGVQDVPPNLVLNGPALILTTYIMYPVSRDMSEAVAVYDSSINVSASISGYLAFLPDPVSCATA